MKAKPKKKDPAAVALGRKGGKARVAAQTPEQRSAAARHAINARWGKTQPPDPKQRWYGLFECFADRAPKLLELSQDKAKLLDLDRTLPQGARMIGFVDLPLPTSAPASRGKRSRTPRLVVQREFAPDPTAQTRALGILADVETGGDS
jgi:hypothetical protein